MKSDCHKSKDHVLEFISGTLPGAEEQAVQAHLHACAECRKYVQSLQDEDACLSDHFGQIEGDMATRQARVLEALACHEAGARTETIPTWRGIVRGRMSRLAAAAAIVVVAVCIVFWQGPSTPAYALDQTIEAMRRVRFVHVVGRDETGEIEEERWIEIGPDGRQIRYRHDKPPHLFVIEDGKSTARYYHNRKAVILCDRDAMPYQWIGPSGATFQNLRREGRIIEENVLFRGRHVHKVWWPMMRNVCYVDPESKRAIAIGNIELSYEDPPAGIFDVVTPEGYTVVDRPLNMSAQAAEEEGLFYVDVEVIPPAQAAVKIVNRDDVIRLYPTGPRRYEGDLDLNIRCDKDVSWGLSITNEAITVGCTHGCRVDKFNLSAPGGVATVGATLKDARLEHLRRGSKLATVRLEFALRPDPMNDARACQRLGFALYDAKRHEEALTAFEKMAEGDNADEIDRGVALLWQGHMLDLLHRRDEAITRYREVAAMGLTARIRHDQYGLAYNFTPYAKERIKTPFPRVENRDAY